MDTLNLFLPLNKVDVAKRLVYGTLAAEIADHSGEIMDYDTAKPAFKAWSDEIAKTTDGKSLGNVRAMHGNVVAGKLVDIQFDDVAKTITGCAYISDDQEWRKCEDGSYTGFSMGGRYAKRWACPANAALKRYTPTVAEVSIVDMPCIPVATFDVIKADGSHEMRKFKAVVEADADLEQVWKARDGSTFAKKADALQKNIDLAVAAVPDAVSAAMEAMKKAQAAMAAKEGADTTEPETVEKVAPAEGATTTTDEPVVIEKSAEEKAAAFAAAVQKAVLGKQLCDLPTLVDVIYNLQWLQGNLEWDTLFDDATVSTLPADLKGILASLCDFLKAMVEDATKDITEDATKAITFDQAEALRKFTGNADLLPSITAPVEAEPAPDLEKVRTEHAAELQKARDDLATAAAREETLTKAVTDMTSGVEALTKRIEHLEAQPAPPKGAKSVTTTVTKGNEGAATGAEKLSVDALTKQFSYLPPVEQRAAVIDALAAQSQ